MLSHLKVISTTLLTIGSIVLFLPSLLLADIYMYVDQEGVIHFTNVPTSSANDYRVYIKERNGRGYYPRSSDQYDDIIKEASHRHGVAFPLLKAIIKAESAFNPRAVSKKGALGLMQIMPKNIQLLKINDPFDPRENIMGGTRYFKELLNQFKGKLSLSLAAYNAGPNAVVKYRNIPPYKETEEYVEKVLKYYYSFKY